LRALIQRVSKAHVAVNQDTVGNIDNGLCIFIGIMENDQPKDIEYIVDKIVNLRIFPNAEGKFDQSVIETKGELLIISQFTLYANTKKGRRPSFTRSAKPQEAKFIFNETINQFEATGLKIQTGLFQSHMNVSIVNDGPVTIFIDSRDHSI